MILRSIQSVLYYSTTAAGNLSQGLLIHYGILCGLYNVALISDSAAYAPACFSVLKTVSQPTAGIFATRHDGIFNVLNNKNTELETSQGYILAL